VDECEPLSGGTHTTVATGNEATQRGHREGATAGFLLRHQPRFSGRAASHASPHTAGTYTEVSLTSMTYPSKKLQLS